MFRPFIAIPRTRAAKAHAGCSFLDFPGEVRGLILANLFESDKAIRIEMKYNAMVEYEEEENNDFLPAEGVPVYSNEHSSINEGIGLLLSCRQLFHEAASVLYSNNTFLLTKASEMHLVIHNYPLYLGWCFQLGFQAQWLRKVHIDLVNGAWEYNSEWMHHGDFRLLAQCMWEPLTKKCDFELVNTRQVNQGVDAEPLVSDIRLMNTVLKAVRADQRNLKKDVNKMWSLDFYPFASRQS